MDDFTQRMIERTRARQEMIAQKKQQHMGSNPQRKRKPLLSQNSEEQLVTRQKLEDGEFSEVSADSPNKRTRTDSDKEVIENVPMEIQHATVDANHDTDTKSKRSSHVNERMQKLLNQRKIWEAEEQGQDISYDTVSLPSPVRNEPAAPASSQRQTQSLDHQGRKRRLAALAARVKGWEDDVSHHNPPKTPEGEKNRGQVCRKPPSGRVQQPAQSVPVAKVAPQTAATVSKVVQNAGDELTVESLVKFAVDGKSAARDSPAKRAGQSVIQIGGSAKTVLQTKQQTIMVSSSHASGDNVASNSKTLQERMFDLQRNGCKTEVVTVSSSSATQIMERARAERQRELEELRKRKVHGIPIHGTPSQSDDKVVISSKCVEQESEACQKQMAVEENAKPEMEEQETGADDSTPADLSESQEQTAEADESFPTVHVELRSDENDGKNQSSMLCEDEADASKYDSSAMDADEEEQGEGGYGDSLLDEDDTDVDQQDLSDSTEEQVQHQTFDISSSSTILEQQLAAVSVSGEKSEKEEQEEEACQMIDDLFEGVLSDDEESILTPPPRSNSPITIPNLTRQKSKLEIKTELTVRKQTCNEAEDTHTLSQPSKFQRACLSKSNSTESIVSLCQENELPLYTISSYRTDKRKSMCKRPVEKRVVRNEAATARATMRKNAENSLTTKDLISNMMQEVTRQQGVIQQASAALNHCFDAQHGKGTITEVEAEKVLLIASEKRLALLSEIQRQKQKRTGPAESRFKPCHGGVVVSNLRLPMRTEYIFSIANRRDAGELRNHYYFVMVRNGHKMFATQLVSTLDDISGDSLVFKDQFKIDNLSSDFQVVLEVYSLNHRTRADGVPVQDKAKGKLSGILHKGGSVEMKKVFAEAVQKTKNKVKKVTLRNSASYDLTEASGMLDYDQSLTPKKLRNSKRSSHLPSMMSPGGPNAIRISNFTLIGSTVVSLDAITGRKFALQKVPFLSPISGQIMCNFSANFQSDVEQRGFLTMFDDVGGLGAWHRRWCALREGKLYSWTYPDDEQSKKPLMTVSLKECISREITTVERILCARPNTFELRTMRPRRHGDKQNLISQDTGSVITTKHWLSADTKEERVVWIESLNQALVDVRAWDITALKPFK